MTASWSRRDGQLYRTLPPAELLDELARSRGSTTRPWLAAGRYRTRPYRRLPRKLAILGAITVLIAGVTGALATTVTDTDACDVTVAANTTSADCTLTSGAIVSYIGSNDTLRQSSGTGLFDPFVRLQGGPVQQGFNTDAAVTFDTKTGKWTHAIKASAIPIVDCDGTLGGPTCWELFVDINENNTAKRISLNEVKIFFTDSNVLTGYTPGTPPTFTTPTGNATTLEYNYQGDIRINDVNSGSGRGDLRYLVPTADHPFTSATWFVLYSKWGTTTGTAGNFGTGGYAADGGFEEWKVRKAPSVTITKTADAATVNAGSNIGFTITVTNSGAADATGVTINDPLPGGSGIDWAESPDNPNCTISGSPPNETLACGPVTLAAGGGSLQVHVQSATTAASCGTYNNTATFTSTDAGSGSASASTTVQCGAIRINKQSTKTGNPYVGSGGTAGTDPTPAVTTDNATFVITPNPRTGSGTLTVVDNGANDGDSAYGQVCVTGVIPAAAPGYSVDETVAPKGYGLPTTNDPQNTGAVTQASTCASGAATISFQDPPLGEIQVLFRDLGSGETKSAITCTGLTPVSENGAADPAFDDTDETYTNLPPGTYSCQVVVDP